LLVLGVVDQPFLDVRCETVKRLVDVDVALCRNLKERDAKLIGECLTPLGRHRAFLFPVAFVADQDFVDSFSSVLLNVLEPGPDICGEVLA
jgi:hypothetical protein